MKTLFTSVLIIFSIIFSNAQDLLFSEDFDYPIGANLNQHNWRPLTSATDNPIKIVAGLSLSDYPASGGAAFLNKNGQDVIRSFDKISAGTLFLNFQIKVQSADKRVTPYFSQAKPISPSNYFMFLSSKEEPTKPLLKFTIQDSEIIYGAENRVSNGYDGVIRTLHILSATNEVINSETFYTKNEIINFTVLYSFATNEISIGRDREIYPLSLSKVYAKNKLKISNLSNIVLSQSDVNVGSTAVIDRIKIGKTWNSIFPCNKAFLLGQGVYKFDDKNRITPFNPNGTIYVFYLDIHLLPKEWYAIANTEIIKPIFRYIIARPDITELSIEAPKGFKVAINDGPLTSKGIVPINKTYSYEPHTYVDFYLVGDSMTIGANQKPIVGKVGVYEGKATIGSNLGCLATTIDLKGIIKTSPMAQSIYPSFDASIFPNTTDGKVNLLINEKAPEGDFEIRLSDKAGNNLYSNSGTWENQQGEIERILSRSPSGQYLFTVKQGNSSKTIRVFRQE
jgi:hypothetical protein